MYTKIGTYYSFQMTIVLDLGPSSGGTTICIQQMVLTVLFRLLSVVLFGFKIQPAQHTVV